MPDPMPFEYGRNGTMRAYATDDPWVAEVVDDETGRRSTALVLVLVKFGWELVEPPGWPATDRFGQPTGQPAPLPPSPRQVL